MLKANKNGGPMSGYTPSQAAAPAPLPNRLGLHWFLLVLALAILGLAGWYFFYGTSPTASTREHEQSQAAPLAANQAPPAGAPGNTARPETASATLKSQLEQVLAGLKEANQKKDLSQLLSYYSPNFPQLTQRAQAISKTWKVYDYSRIEFEIQGIEVKNATTAFARVAWNATAQNIETKQVKIISKTYRVTFVCEAGQWHIKALEGSPHQTK
jgi:hypothetical protein